jgi:hypothetical protein
MNPSTDSLLKLVDGPLDIVTLSKMEIAKGLQMQMYMVANQYDLPPEHPVIQDIGNSYFDALEDLVYHMKDKKFPVE